MKDCLNGPGHMTRMPATSILSVTKMLMTWKLGIQYFHLNDGDRICGKGKPILDISGLRL